MPSNTLSKLNFNEILRIQTGIASAVVGKMADNDGVYVSAGGPRWSNKFHKSSL